MQALSCQSRAQARLVRSSGRSRQRVAVVQAKKTADGPSIAIVGVTGAVGQEFLQVSSPTVLSSSSSSSTT
jgi:aspartate-semialdehyde dehydrogenase